MEHISFSISAKKVGRYLIGIVLVLAVVHLAAHIFQYSMPLSYQLMDIINRVDVGDEISIPTWVAQFLLLICAVLLALIAYTARSTNQANWKSWGWLSGIFTLGSIDEGASLHELLAYLEMPARLGISSGYFGFLWVIPGMIIVLLICGYFWSFWWSLPKPTRNLFGLAAFLFVSGAIGVEMLGANHYSQYGPDSYTFSGVYALIEEGMEMAGATLFIYALLDYIRKQKVRFVVNFDE